MRRYSYSRDLNAGCFVCWGSEGRWRSKNAQALAARHHDATGHETWCEVYMSIRYGDAAPEKRKP